MPTNVLAQTVKSKLEVDMVEKPENRVHKLTKLTNSNGAQLYTTCRSPLLVTKYVMVVWTVVCTNNLFWSYFHFSVLFSINFPSLASSTFFLRYRVYFSLPSSTFFLRYRVYFA